MTKGECDCCAKRNVNLRRGEVCGIETYACAECHGYEPEAFDDDE